jgi:hypothetical protein
MNELLQDAGFWVIYEVPPAALMFPDGDCRIPHLDVFIDES